MTNRPIVRDLYAVYKAIPIPSVLLGETGNYKWEMVGSSFDPDKAEKMGQPLGRREKDWCIAILPSSAEL